MPGELPFEYTYRPADLYRRLIPDPTAEQLQAIEGVGQNHQDLEDFLATLGTATVTNGTIVSQTRMSATKNISSGSTDDFFPGFTYTMPAAPSINTGASGSVAGSYWWEVAFYIRGNVRVGDGHGKIQAEFYGTNGFTSFFTTAYELWIPDTDASGSGGPSCRFSGVVRIGTEAAPSEVIAPDVICQCWNFNGIDSATATGSLFVYNVEH